MPGIHSETLEELFRMGQNTLLILSEFIASIFYDPNANLRVN